MGADQLVLGNGSNDVLELIARAYLQPGDEEIVARRLWEELTRNA